MTDQAFNDQCRDLSSRIAKLYDDVEDPMVVLSALIPCVAQNVMNVAYVRQAPLNAILDCLAEDLRDCTAKLFLFMQTMHKGDVQ